MRLQEILERYPQRANSGVPDWMLGYFRRRAISFANGQTDTSTTVCWIQSRTFTIDLRLPIAQVQPPHREWADYLPAELEVLANYEGWAANSEWTGETLSWHGESSLQLRNRWPEPALLQRVGNCMIEFAPSGAYVEDWRLQPSRPGPLIGLRLIEERDLDTGVRRHRGGGLIICGDHAALVLGRADDVIPRSASGLLRDEVAEAVGDAERLAHLFNFETSVASGSMTTDYRVEHSTCPARVGQLLCPLDGFEYLPDSHQVVQQLTIEGSRCERRFEVDTIEAAISFKQATDFSEDAAAWYDHESPTLTRYTEPHY